ncbi:unnamed protein product [Rhizophagus irregularis]|nr:unnamed protein product [Rhizophagus irregularis]
MFSILDGKREDIIDGTPSEYSKLYKDCWKYEPNERPDTQGVALILKAMISSEPDDDIEEEKECCSSEKSQSSSKSIRGITIDSNYDLKLDNVISFLNSDYEEEIEDIPSSATTESSMDINLKLEEDGFITPDEKVEKLIKALTETKYLYALKSLFENLQISFFSQTLINSLKALSDPISFNNYSKECAPRLELHLRTWIIVLERICFSPIVLKKVLRDELYDSLSKFAEIYHNITQVTQNQVMRNYNIDFLLIHLRDTLHSLHHNSIAFQELLRRVKDLLRNTLNIIPSKVTISNDNNFLLMLTQLCQSISFKYSVASYYVDWKIMLTIQHNLFNWSEGSEKIISRKFGEMILMEYLWNYLEREWTNKYILDSQTEFDEVLIKLSKELEDSDSLLNEPTKNEILTLPDTLWFGLLDLAQNLIQKSTRKSTYGLCYYLAIESLNRAPNDFIQFKAIEILLHLHNINNELFSMIEHDLDQYIQKLNKINVTDSSEKFQILLKFIKEKCFKDFNILNDKMKKEKGKSLEQNVPKQEQKKNDINILDFIAIEMTCSISKEPTDQLCFLKCQHMISLNNLNKFKQNNNSKDLKCPECREIIEENDIRYLSQQVIYKNLYSYFFEAGFILPSIESDSNHDNTNSDNSADEEEADIMLNKKMKVIREIKEIKLNSRLLQLMFQSKKQNPAYQNVIKELEEKNYEQAILKCKEYVEKFPKTYTMRCILAYAYRNIHYYEKANLYLNEAIKLKKKNPIAYYIRGEIFFRQGQYELAIFDLNTSINYKFKNNVSIILGNSYFLKAENQEKHQEKDNDYNCALKNYNITLKDNPSNYLCLKNCAYIYANQENYLNALDMLNKLLAIIKQNDSLILCYYGEILNNLKRYDESIIYFTKAYNIDPENTHVIIKRAITYYLLQEYDNALLDLKRVIKLDSSSCIAYYYKGLTYYTMENVNNALKAFDKCIELDPNDNLSKMITYHLRDLSDDNDLNIPNINDDNSLLFMKCKIYIKLKKYDEAMLDLNRLFELNNDDISFTYLLREYSDFWSYLCDYYEISNNEFTELGIVDNFSTYMYKVKNVFFVSNLINLNCKFYQFLESDSNSLLGQVLSFKDESLPISLPKLTDTHEISSYFITWKINVKEILSKNCFIKFVIVEGKDNAEIFSQKHVLKYEDVLKLSGLGWIEYTLPFTSNTNYTEWRPSIEFNPHSIILKMDYVRLIRSKREKIYFPKMGHFLPIHKLHPNVPETFKDKYFSKKDMEKLVELKDIINH